MMKQKLLLAVLLAAMMAVCAGAVNTVFPVPATDESGVTRWGYLNENGKQITPSEYTSASEFDETGLAAVTDPEGRAALLNSRGESVTGWLEAPLSIASDGVYHALRYEERVDYYDGKGVLAGSVAGAEGFPGDGLIAASAADEEGTLRYGYATLEGELVIEPRFTAVGAFHGGRALARAENGAVCILDREGQTLEELPAEAEPTSLDIYDGGVVILRMHDKYALYSTDEMKFITTLSYDELLPFDRTTARCRVGNLWGLVRADGSVALEPTYPYLSYMGEGVYAARGTDLGAAAVDETGEVLYRVETYVGGFRTFESGLSWHGDLSGNVVFFNANGTFAKTVAGIESPSVMTAQIVRVVREGTEEYLNIYTGKTVYSTAREYTLPDGSRITTERYERYLGMRDDGTEYGYYVQYPHLSGLADGALETRINDAISAFFVSGPTGTQDRSLDATYGFSIEGRVLVVWASGVSGLDNSAAIWNDSIGIDLDTGDTYITYDSLFKPDSAIALSRYLPKGAPYFGSARMDSRGVTFFRNYPATAGEEPYAESVRLSFEELAPILDFDGACYRALSGFRGVVFEDVPYDHWAFHVIGAVAREGWMLGSEGEFRPSGLLTQAEGMATLSRVLGLADGTMPLVDESKWYASDVGALYESGLLDGFEEPWFSLEQPMTRGDAMQLMAGALRKRGAKALSARELEKILADCIDGDEIPLARRAAAALCIKHGIIQGGEYGAAAARPFTRAEYAQMLRSLTGLAID